MIGKDDNTLCQNFIDCSTTFLDMVKMAKLGHHVILDIVNKAWFLLLCDNHNERSHVNVKPHLN